MDLRPGTSSPTEGLTRLHAVPDDALAAVDAYSPSGFAGAVAGLEEDLHADLALLRDAAALVTARLRLDGLLLQLTVNPFDSAAYRGLGSYLIGPGVRALAAYERVSASTLRGI